MRSDLVRIRYDSDNSVQSQIELRWGIRLHRMSHMLIFLIREPHANSVSWDNWISIVLLKQDLKAFKSERTYVELLGDWIDGIDCQMCWYVETIRLIRGGFGKCDGAWPGFVLGRFISESMEGLACCCIGKSWFGGAAAGAWASLELP